MTFKIKHAVAAAACLIGGAVAAPSQAAIFIALQEAGVNGGAITTVATGPTSAIFNHAYGTFELELLTAQQSVSPMLLGSTTSDNNIRGSGGTLNIYITRNDITGPVPFHYLSSFTSNTLPKKWTMTESTYVSTSNALYTGALLATHTFPAIGTFAAPTAFAGGETGPYSITTRFTVTAPTTGGALSTIAVRSVAVPEPGTWALMIMGFGGAGAMLRRRRLATATL